MQHPQFGGKEDDDTTHILNFLKFMDPTEFENYFIFSVFVLIINPWIGLVSMSLCTAAHVFRLEWVTRKVRLLNMFAILLAASAVFYVHGVLRNFCRRQTYSSRPRYDAACWQHVLREDELTGFLVRHAHWYRYTDIALTTALSRKGADNSHMFSLSRSNRN